MNKLLLLIVVFVFIPPAKGEYALIINKSANKHSLTKFEIKSIFLGKKTIWKNGITILPCYTEPNSAATQRFFEALVKRNYYMFIRYWNKRLFAGEGHPPLMFDSNEQLIDYVRQNKGAICFSSNLPATLPETIIPVKLDK